MKIYCVDTNLGKFTTDMVDYWKSCGHEVDFQYSYDPSKVDWADVVWFDCLDNNVVVATQGEDLETKKKVVVRAIDIEVWCGIWNSVNFDYITDLIFTCPHIKKLVTKELPYTKVHIIPLGVNVERFSFRKQPQKGYNIAWVAERWYAKGIDYFLQYAAMLHKVNPAYKIYCVGIWADNATSGYYRAYIDQFLEKNPMNVEFIERVEDMNKFLEDMNYTICFSKKETFSYATAEGMCKGLKPIIHNFYGAEDIWDKKYIWNTIDEAIKMTINDDYNPFEYRKYITDKYSLIKMVKEVDEVLSDL
jgi:glycosyltransferase involved in cell wall biosynthesis